MRAKDNEEREMAKDGFAYRAGAQWGAMSWSSRLGSIAIVAALAAILWVYWLIHHPASKPVAAPQVSSGSAQPSVQRAVEQAPPPTPYKPVVVTPTTAWDYRTSVDQMTGKTSSQATIVSDNQLRLDFPYSGPQYAALTVRRHPQYGLDVVLAIEKGQILCRSYGDCTISVKFDDAAPIKFGGTEPADNSTTMVFINGPDRFIKSAKKAKRILVQLNIYQNGSPVLEFSSPVPLEWPPK